MARLSVNVDHVATIRQARRDTRPDPVTAAMLAEIAGANGITVHLREDRRHIQERDLKILREMVKTALNLEMAATPEMSMIALNVKPDMVTIVPEKREELTTEGGLDLNGFTDDMEGFIANIKAQSIRVNLFIDPDPAQIRRAKELGANGIEIHTGSYANAKGNSKLESEFKRIVDAAGLAKGLDLSVHAGHGLDYHNILRVAGIREIEEFAIGFSIIARSIIVGIDRAVREMIELIG